MPVNGIELKEGQIWEDNVRIQRTIKRNPSGSVDFPWIGENTEGGGYSTLTNDGRFNGVDYSYYDLNKLIYNPESEEKTAMTNKFNPKSEPTKLFLPKPGDKIICNNGEEFICCTKEQLKISVIGISEIKDICGLTKDGRGWQDWNAGGTSCLEYDDWAIREVIPQSSEASADKKEEVKEEPRYKAATALRTALLAEGLQVEQSLYTLQEIKEAWDACGWVIATSSWSNFQKNLMKIKSPEYQEYLRLKAIYE